MKHKGNLISAQFSPDGRWVVTALGEYAGRLWDAATGRPVGEPMQHEGWVVLEPVKPPHGRARADRLLGSHR